MSDGCEGVNAVSTAPGAERAEGPGSPRASSARTWCGSSRFVRTHVPL